MFDNLLLAHFTGQICNACHYWSVRCLSHGHICKTKQGLLFTVADYLCHGGYVSALFVVGLFVIWNNLKVVNEFI